MGISGLLPRLKSAVTRRHISTFAGHRIGIDASAWLHRAAFKCAMDLCLGNATSQHIDWIIQQAQNLIANRVVPVFVFDGARHPLKAREEGQRRDNRQENLELGKQLLAEGRHKEATQKFQQSVSITSEMVQQLQSRLRDLHIEFIVSPYEADAQLAYLCRIGYIRAAISEDSDLLVFGALRVLFKFDTQTGEFDELSLNSLATVTDPNFNLSTFQHDQFQVLAVLCGCDYLPSIPKIGPVKAWELVHQYRTACAVIAALRFDRRFSIPHLYDLQIERVLLAFQHHRVWDPIKKTVVCLDPRVSEQTDWLRYIAQEHPELNDNLPESKLPIDTEPAADGMTCEDEKLWSPFIGYRRPPSLAEAMARGLVHPDTGEPYPRTPVQRQLSRTPPPSQLSRSSSSSSSSVSSFETQQPAEPEETSVVERFRTKLLPPPPKMMPFKPPAKVDATTSTSRIESRQRTLPSMMLRKRQAIDSESQQKSDLACETTAIKRQRVSPRKPLLAKSKNVESL